MNLQLIFQGLIEISISLITGLLIFFGSFKIFTIITKNLDELKELKEKNTAIGILIASFVFGIMLLVKSAIGPAVDTLGSILGKSELPGIIIIYAILRIIFIYIIAAVFSFLVLWLSMNMFMILTTKIDEIEEIKNNNYSITIVLTVLILSISIILSQPLTTLLQGVMASPQITQNEPLFNLEIIIEGLIQLGISFFVVIFIFYSGFKIFNLLTRNINEVEELKSNNLAVSIFLSSFIFSMMIIIKASIEPANDALGYALKMDTGILSVIFAALRIVIFFILSAIFALIILWLAIKAFMLLTTSIEEMTEIKNNNIAVSIIIAILLISTALLLSHGLTILLNGLIRTPKVEGGLQNILPIN